MMKNGDAGIFSVYYCTALIAMQGQQKNIEKKNLTSNMVVIIYCYIPGRL